MRALRLLAWKSEAVLVEVDDPVPVPGEVVVRLDGRPAPEQARRGDGLRLTRSARVGSGDHVLLLPGHLTHATMANGSLVPVDTALSNLKTLDGESGGAPLSLPRPGAVERARSLGIG